MGAEETMVAAADPSAVRLSGVALLLDRLAEWDARVRSRWPFAALVPDVSAESAGDDYSRLLLRPALLGFVALVAISAGVSQQRSPFALKLPGAWFFGVPASANSGSSHQELLGLVAVYGGLVLLMRVWYGLIRTLSRVPGVPVKKLAGVAGLWIVPLLVAPPLFSRDVYSYAAQGEMMSHHISPYLYGPGVLGATPMVSLVDKLWLNVPAPYGPLFMGGDGLAASVAGHHELATVVILRLMAVLGVALIAIGTPMLARSLGRDPAHAFTLAVLNPVTVLHLVGGAHNDALMLGLLVLGVALAKRGRPLAGILVCTLATAVKAPAAIGIIYIAWDWMGTGLPWRSRVRPLVTAGLLAGAVMAFLSVVTGLGWSWVFNLATPGTVRSWMAPATAAGLLLTDVAHLFQIPVAQHVVLSVTRVVGLGVAAGTGVWLLRNVERFGTLRAMGLTMLLVVLLGPVDQPWYLSWGLVVLAPVATGRVRSLIVVLSVSSAFLGLPGGRQLLSDLLHANPLTVAVALLTCLAVLTVPLTPFDREQVLQRWRRRRDDGDHDRPAPGRGVAELDLLGV